MLSNNHKSQSCEFAESLMSYLYDEIPASEKRRFETHLTTCATCADELTDFQVTRSSILEWRDQEFLNLETPVISIPAIEQEKSFASAAVSTEPISWFAKIKQTFLFNPAFAAGVLGILIVGIGATLFLLSASNQTNIAGTKKNAKNTIDKTLAQATVSPTAEIIQAPERIADVTDKGAKKNASPVSETSNSPEKVNRERQVPVNNAVVKVSDTATKNNAENPAPNLKATKNAVKKNTTAPKRSTPSLIDADEDEDDSIRLADLFAEIETK